MIGGQGFVDVFEQKDADHYERIEHNATAAGARRWNDANVLALSLRATSEAELAEILDAWFDALASEESADRANVAHLAEIERG